jgi:nicotinate-nucleotide--dimethylbenzimidazole phosphoribosyltransferase
MTAPATLDEIRRTLRALPGPDLAAASAASEREAQLTKPPGALGRLEEIAFWLASWQGRHPPRIDHPRVVVFAGNHGVAARGVSAYPAAVTAQMVQNFIAGGAAINQLCKAFDADLRVYEMALDRPSADFTQAAALSEDECARAIAYGMMAVEPGLDLLCIGEMGIANTTAAAALCLALYGGDAADWTGPGTGVAGEALTRKRAVVAEGAALHAGAIRQSGGDGLEVLRRLGGHELAAMVGAIIAARFARTPVLLDGFVGCAAAATLAAAAPGALDHCLAAHRSAEPGHARLLERLAKRPLLDLDMRLGEASGAALALGLVRAAVACHTGMATFAEAGVSGKA